ncbi:hypothetical protein [Pseudomonas sp. TCU-HL1]|nr:hypothetical protein [Pseudomonas sp. TCU-HL1]
MSNVRFLPLRAAIEALALKGIQTQGDLVATGKQLREVKHG